MVKKANKIEIQIEQTNKRIVKTSNEINNWWDEWEDDPDLIYPKIHFLDERLNRLFSGLWDLSYDDESEFELIAETKGFDKRGRMRYCNGAVHLISDKDDNLLYGTICNCK